MFRGGVVLVLLGSFFTILSVPLFPIDNGKKALLGSGFSGLIDLKFLIASRWAKVDFRPSLSEDFRR